MRARHSRPWISIALLVAFTGVALPDDPKAGAKPAAKSSVVQTKESQGVMTPAKALDALKEGNKRFRAGTSVQKNLIAKVKASAAGQYPFAVVLSCMDSRVPAEAVFFNRDGSGVAKEALALDRALQEAPRPDSLARRLIRTSSA